MPRYSLIQFTTIKLASYKIKVLQTLIELLRPETRPDTKKAFDQWMDLTFQVLEMFEFPE